MVDDGDLRREVQRHRGDVIGGGSVCQVNALLVYMTLTSFHAISSPRAARPPAVPPEPGIDALALLFESGIPLSRERNRR
jgi:hypothetical protein